MTVADESDRRAVWRYVPPIAAPGRVQMQIDRWLLQQHGAGKLPSVLRFYTWSPPAASLGYHQHSYPDRWQEIQWQNEPLAIVRRPTGGRAVLHQGDLTYAIVTSNLSGNAIAAYRFLSEFLIAGWRRLGVELAYAGRQPSGDRAYTQRTSCFATRTSADLVLATGEKFVGSAQLRQGRAVLQHGSMVLEPDAELYRSVFGDRLSLPRLSLPETGARLRQSAIAALKAAARSHFRVEWMEAPLSDREMAEIEEIPPETGAARERSRSPNTA